MIFRTVRNPIVNHQLVCVLSRRSTTGFTVSLGEKPTATATAWPQQVVRPLRSPFWRPSERILSTHSHISYSHRHSPLPFAATPLHFHSSTTTTTKRTRNRNEIVEPCIGRFFSCVFVFSYRCYHCRLGVHSLAAHVGNCDNNQQRETNERSRGNTKKNCSRRELAKKNDVITK